jgi:hypothetical protein
LRAERGHETRPDGIGTWRGVGRPLRGQVADDVLQEGRLADAGRARQQHHDGITVLTDRRKQLRMRRSKERMGRLVLIERSDLCVPRWPAHS